MNITARPRSATAAALTVGTLLMTGCNTGAQSQDVTAATSQSVPSTLQIQVAQTPDHDFTMAAGGVGSGQIQAPQPTAAASTDAFLEAVDESAQESDSPELSEVAAGRHVVIIDNADDSPVATGRLDLGVATLPPLVDGDYTAGLLETSEDGWISGIGIVDVRISGGMMRAAVPETHTRRLPAVLEQAQPGELIVNASPSAQQAAPSISWRLDGPVGDISGEEDGTRAVLDISVDGEYTLEIRAAQEDAPEIILQSVRYTFTVTDGEVG